MLSISDAVNNLASRLELYFESRGFQWKSNESLDAFFPSKPKIYQFCVPPTDLNAQQMPVHCPTILISFTKWQRISDQTTKLELAVNCVTVDAAVLDQEKTYKQTDGSYKFGTIDNYEQDATSLYRGCLLLAECIVDAIHEMSHTTHDPLRIEVIEFVPPHALLPDYPYAVCVVPVSIHIINNCSVHQSLQEYL